MAAPTTIGTMVTALRIAAGHARVAADLLAAVSAAPDDSIDYLGGRFTRIALSCDNEADYLVRHTADLDAPAETA